MLRYNGQLWHAFFQAQRKPVTDVHLIHRNLYRFIIISIFAALCLLVSVVTIVIRIKKIGSNAAVRKYLFSVPVITEICLSGTLVINNLLGAIAIRAFKRLPKWFYTLAHLANAVGAAVGSASVIITLCFVATLSRVRADHEPTSLFVGMSVLNLLVQTMLVAAIVFISYESTVFVGARLSKLTIIFLAACQLFIGLALIIYNWAPIQFSTVLPLFQQLTGVSLMSLSITAITLSASVKEKYASNQLVSSLIRGHTIQMIIFELGSICVFGVTLFEQAQSNKSDSINIILIGISLGTAALCGILVNILQRVPKSDLRVEKIDLFKLSAKQRTQFAAKITANKRIGEPDGIHAMGLMTGYSKWQGDNISCQVLRVYRRTIEPSQQQIDTAPPSAPDPNARAKVKGGRGGKSLSRSGSVKSGASGTRGTKGFTRGGLAGALRGFKRESSAMYDNIKAWSALDEEKWIFEDGFDAITLTDTSNKPVPVTTKTKPKRRDKKLMKKLAAGGQLTPSQLQALALTQNGGGLGDVNSIPGSSTTKLAGDEDGSDDEKEFGLVLEEEEQGIPEVEFNKMLETTEALILLTCIDRFDLTSEIPGKLGDWMRQWFGKDSKSRWLCVRLGLVGTHWPFRPAIFRCSKTRRPVARNAAILRSLTEWNNELSPANRFSFLLAPHYKDDNNTRGVQPSGWREMSLPPTHILDLRPYSNLDLKGFLKAIKYRDQAKAFERAGGQVIVSQEFKPEEYNTAYSLWRSVAQKRSDEGRTSNLAEPDPALFATLADRVVNAGKTWSLLFLKVNDQTIASSVLVKLGDTITSDIQGLDYEEGHKMKAYFVMMQSTIEIALKEKISFVEFGPSTAKAKTDIGCSSIKMTGALYIRNSLLSLIVRVAAKNVDI